MTSNLTNKRFSPFLSTFFIVTTLLLTVFVKMEIVREGYEVLKVGHSERQEIDSGRRLLSEYSRLLRPKRLDQIATQKLDLVRAQKTQVVLMASKELAIRQ